MNLFKRANQDFKPDPKTATWVKTLHLTVQQRQRLSKWLLYCLTLILAVVVQDVIMSRIRFLGGTTDLAICVILLITILEGTETGSLFVLIASAFYYFSGSAPGAYSIGLLCFLGVTATLLRQMYLHRSKGSVVLCSCLAAVGYELGLFIVGIFSELTLFSRLPSFLVTSAACIITIIPLYKLIYKFGLIGGNTWKE